tara:strand:+ start:1182 stop:1406 length:225 start_codon:yes stop_codon:yes gene_type:complete
LFGKLLNLLSYFLACLGWFAQSYFLACLACVFTYLIIQQVLLSLLIPAGLAGPAFFASWLVSGLISSPERTKKT